MAPAGSPAPVVDKWNSVINELIAQADVRQKILDTGGEIVGGSAQQMKEAYTADRARLAPLIQKSNITLD